MSAEAFQKLPTLESCRLVEFENAEVRSGIVKDTYFLVVSGNAPCLNMQIWLEPRVYVTQPEYWGIEVVGCLAGGICLTAVRPFTESIALAGITGTKGIEVVGSTQTKQFDVPPTYGAG